MAVLILDVLGPRLPGTIDKIIFPAELRGLLDHLATDDPMPNAPVATPIKGSVKASANDTAGGFANLDIDPLGPAIPFTLRLTGPAATPTGFQFDLEPASGLLKLPAACAPASVQVDERASAPWLPPSRPMAASTSPSMAPIRLASAPRGAHRARCGKVWSRSMRRIAV